MKAYDGNVIGSQLLELSSNEVKCLMHFDFFHYIR